MQFQNLAISFSGSDGTCAVKLAYCFSWRHFVRNHQRFILAAVAVLASLPAGCRIETSEQKGGENVKIATLFGGMQVKTDQASVEQGLGLPVYPGAEMVTKHDKDNGSADVNLSFGRFQLRVKAASYRTPDAPDKVQQFYKDALKRYGVVIQCSNSQPVGTPAITDEGLTCGHAKTTVNVVDDVSGKTELKAGSRQHQHIVAVNPQPSGTEFNVIALDLPESITVDDGDGQQQ